MAARGRLIVSLHPQFTTDVLFMMLGNAVRRPVGQPSAPSPRKLRDSCTDCASSKVRCSKEKPTCARCARRGMTCTYMISRRTGRTSSTASKADAAHIWVGASRLPAAGPARTLCRSTESSPGTRSVLTDQNRPARANKPSLHVAITSLSHTTLPTGEQAHYAGPGAVPEADLWSSLLSPSIMLDGLAELSPPLTVSGTEVDDLFELDLRSSMVLDCSDSSSVDASLHTTVTPPELFGDIPFSVSDPDFSSTTPSSAFDWALPSSTIPNPPSCCFAIGLEILSRLSPNAPSVCTLPTASHQPDTSPPRAQTTESVISENKDIIETLTSLIDCDCSQDEYLLFIMTLIALRVMGSYAAAVAGDESPPSPTPVTPPPSSSSSSSSTAHSPTTKPNPGPAHQTAMLRSWPGSSPSTAAGPKSTRPTHRRPLSSSASSFDEQSFLGVRSVGGQRRERTAAQLVLGELHRVQGLVNMLGKRLEYIRRRAGSYSGQGPQSGSELMADSGRARTAGFSAATLFQLEEDLRTGLRVLCKETVEVLSRS